MTERRIHIDPRHLLVWTSWWSVIFLLLADPVLAQWPVGPIPISRISYRVSEGELKGYDWEAVGTALIGLKVGNDVTPETLDHALARFDPVGDADAEVVPTDTGVALSIELRPHRRIKTIRIRGVYPLFERDVRSVMTIGPGSIFNPDILDDQAELIAQRYRREGYIAPNVLLLRERDPDDGHILVTVQIEKGSAYRAVQVDIFGNRVFSDAHLKEYLAGRRWRKGLFGSKRFSDQQIEEDLDSLTQFYRQKGYADVRITSAISKDPQEQQVRVRLDINEGPHYEVAVSGNHFFSDRVLKKDLVLFETGNRGNVGLRRSLQAIRRRYVEAGFANARVRYKDTGKEVLSKSSKPSEESSNRNQQRIIRIDIEEGNRHIVQSVSIDGNTHLSDERIGGQMLTHPPKGLNPGVYVVQVLQEDLDAVRALYYQNGFLDLQLSEKVSINPESHQVTVTVMVEEGVQTRVGDIAFEGSHPFPEHELRDVLELASGKVFWPYLVENDENRLSAHISRLGYPHVRVKAEVTFADHRKRADIVYRLAPGPLVKVGRIVFAGNFRTNARILRRDLGFDEGDVFSLEQVTSAQRKLRDLNLFDSVQMHIVGLKERSPTVHLIFETPEKRPYYVELGGGYTTEKGIYGRTKIGDHNFLGTNKDVWAAGEAAETGYRLDTGITNPRLWGSQVRTGLELFLEHREEFNQDFGTDSSGSTLTFARDWSRHIATSLALTYEHRTQFPRNGTGIDADNEQAFDERIFWVITPFIRYDNRDSFIRPTTGILSNFSIDVSTGLKGSLDNFLRYSFDVRGFHSPLPRLTLAAIGRLGYLTPMGAEDQLPQDQLFFLGGTATVRGFGESLLRYDANGNPVGGRLALSSSLEARYDVGRNFELAIFLDGGALRDAPSQPGMDDWRWSTGLGLRYITPIGPIGLLYGHKLDRRPGETSGQFHFSIGYTF